MRNLAQGGYNNEQVLAMLKAHRTIAFDYALLNQDEKLIRWLSKASGSVSFNSGQEVMGTASFEVLKEEIQGNYYTTDMRIAPYFKLLTPAGWLKWPLGVYIMTTPKQSAKYGKIHSQVECYDKGIILKEDKITDRLYIPPGSNYVNQIRSVIASAGIKVVNIPSSPLTCSTGLEYDIGSEKLQIVNDLLYAINYTPLHFDSAGIAVSAPYIEAIGRNAEESYITDKNSVIADGTTQSNDLYNVPNVVVRYVDNPDGAPLRSIYTNENAESPISTVRRGRKIVDVESVDDIADQKTLDAYTRRVAIEKSQINDIVTLPTALMPHHGYKNCLYVRHDKMDIGSKYIEESWNMELAAGGTMNHNLRKVTFI